MKTPIDRYTYELPAALIAHSSVEPRDHSRLLVLDRQTGATRHTQFFHILDELQAGDVLVMNETKVFRARLRAKKEGSETIFEVVLLRPQGDVWHAMIRPGKRAKVGTVLYFGDDLSAEVVAKRDDGVTELKFSKSSEEVFAYCDLHGEVPIPPYVTPGLEDLTKYQTVYARDRGSVAAPTAGFHFTEELLKKIEQKGVEILKLTLHVGLGTFQPVKTEVVEEHPMHAEWVDIKPAVTASLLRAKKEGRRVIAVGTTTTRALEGWAKTESFASEVGGFSGDVNLFITPGFSFKIIDGLITNFHLPKTTLLVLVSTFGGYEHVMQAYHEAVAQGYRFYSFGDAMFLR